MPAALLDVDGTLVDTNYHHALAWFRAFRRHEIGLPVWRIHSKLADAWTTKDDVDATKPEPDLVLAALEKAGGGSAVMVGDTPWDIEAARPAGVDTICVITGGYSEQKLREAGAVAVFEGVDELRQNLDETPLSFS